MERSNPDAIKDSKEQTTFFVHPKIQEMMDGWAKKLKTVNQEKMSKAVKKGREFLKDGVDRVWDEAGDWKEKGEKTKDQTRKGLERIWEAGRSAAFENRLAKSIEKRIMQNLASAGQKVLHPMEMEMEQMSLAIRNLSKKVDELSARVDRLQRSRRSGS